MPRPDTIEVSIQTLFGDEAEQGREIAKLDVSTYKHAGGNAARVFVRTCQPKAGRYMAVWQDHDGSAALIFEVKYPEAVIRTNGRDELVGGPYGWNRGNGTVLKMTDHYRRPAPPLDREMLEAAVPGVMAAVVMAHPCTFPTGFHKERDRNINDVCDPGDLSVAAVDKTRKALERLPDARS